MSLASHKTYGPKGIGALYVRRKPRVRIEAQMHGGGHERGMRSGTLPTHQIVGMGEAFRIAREEMGSEMRARSACCTRSCVDGLSGHRADVPQRPSRAARAAQRQHVVQLRRGRVAHHGRQGHRRLVGIGLHVGQPRAELRAAGARPQRRAGALEPAHDDRPLHDRGRDRLRRLHAEGSCRQAARADRRCGTCTRKASTSAPSSGRRTDAVPHR